MRRDSLGSYMERLASAASVAEVDAVAVELRDEVPESDPDLWFLVEKASLARALVQDEGAALRLALAEVERAATQGVFATSWQPPRSRARRRIAAWVRLQRRGLRRGLPKGVDGPQSLLEYLRAHGLTELSMRTLPWYRHNRSQLDAWLTEAHRPG